MPVPLLKWLLFADPRVAPLWRSRPGSITPIIYWLRHADHHLAPMCRSVTPPTYSLLRHSDGNKSVARLLDEYKITADSVAFPMLTALVAQRVILLSLSETVDENLVTSKMSNRQVGGGRLVSETLRVRSVEHTLASVRRRRHLIGVTRLADVTDFDVVGIPTATAARPAVSRHQITATQGKGLTLDNAYVSAMMEAVERHAANQFVPVQVASVGELIHHGRPFVGAAELGGLAFGDERVEWVETRDLDSNASILVPAAAVMFPYEGVGAAQNALRPMITGLAAGNTLDEATLHGMLEVIERDAISRHMLTGGGLLVDVQNLDGPERLLVDRFSAARIQLHVVDLSPFAVLPTYVVRTFGGYGVMAHVSAAGQGTGLSHRVALRRALLEAAQSRIVAIMGSREDLRRVSGDWSNTYEDALSKWEHGVSVSRSHGTTSVPSNSDDVDDLGDALELAIAAVRRKGLNRILVADLTVPAVGIPVARVLIPGLIDAVSRGVRQ